MTGKSCEHGLTTKECLVCASAKYGAALAEPAAEPVADDLTVAYMVGFHKGKEAHPPRAPLTPVDDEDIASEYYAQRVTLKGSVEIAYFAAGVRWAEERHGIKESE